MKTKLSLLALATLTFSCQEKTKNERPNIVMILADDMGFSDLGCYGSEINTPNLDQLADNGLRFTQFTNTSKSFPSRACLLTGLYAQQCGMGKQPAYITNAITIGEVLKKAGYRTLMSGKHHGKDNMYNRGFDRYYGLRDGACNFFNPGKQRPGEPAPAHKTWAKPRKWCIDDSVYAPYTPKEKDFYTTDYFTKYAIQYLDDYQDEKKPFFLYLSYTAPHAPLQAWPEDIARYEEVYKKGYETIRLQRYKTQLKSGLIDSSTYPLSTPDHLAWDSLSTKEKKDEARRMQVYAAMIDRMDQKIGEVINKLKEMDEYENTIIMFASDNGGAPAIFPEDGGGFSDGAGEGTIGSIDRWGYVGTSWANVSNTPYRYYKNWSHQGGICTPFIVHWPGKIEPGITEYPGHFIDLMPTLIDLAEAQYPEEFNGDTLPNLAGESFVDVLTNNKNKRNTTLFYQWQNGKAVRHNDYKLVWESHTPIKNLEQLTEGPDEQKGSWALYNMTEDKTETRNIASEKPAFVNEMTTMYIKWSNQMKKYEKYMKKP